jgi:hypothetical protein
LDSLPDLNDSRQLTLEDSVGFFNLTKEQMSWWILLAS